MKYPHHTHFLTIYLFIYLFNSHYVPSSICLPSITMSSRCPFVIFTNLASISSQNKINIRKKKKRNSNLLLMIIYNPYIFLAIQHKQKHYTHQHISLSLSPKMATSPTHINGHTPLLSNEEEPPHSAPIFRGTGRRTPSFSSSSSSSWDSSFRSSSFSFHDDFPPFSPITPLKYKGVPFSWEQIPGIPKEQGSKKKGPSGHLLPPPPAGTTAGGGAGAKKQLHQDEISPKKSNRFQRDDPFFAALVECSKEGGDDEDHQSSNFVGIAHKGSSKITRSLSGRFGLINMYTSCKRTCTVSESIVYLPRQGSHYLLNRRSS